MALDVKGYLRRKTLEDIYARMSDDDRRLLLQMSAQDRSSREIMEALRGQQASIDRLRRTQQSFASDFASNIAGNAAYDMLLWIARRILKR
jgi:hypothetical protein